MKTALEYAAEVRGIDPVVAQDIVGYKDRIFFSESVQVAEAVIAAERAEADRRVEQAKKAGDRYREMLVGAILRATRRTDN